MTTKLRLLAALFLALGMVGMRSAHPTFAAAQVADCSFNTIAQDLQAGGDYYYAKGQCPNPITFANSITIVKNASLTAQGNDVTLDGNGTQMFFLDSVVSFGLTGLTLSHGSAPQGGAIQNLGGTVTIANSTLSGNSADLYGGAIYNNGTATVTNSTLSGNFGSAGAGAIQNNGTVTITNSSLSGNSATASGGASGPDVGGAIGNTGTATITNSTLSGNSAGNGGGAIFNSGTVTITNSTLSGSSAADRSSKGYATGGGAINNSGGTATVTDSTLSGNSASISGGAIYDAVGTVSVGGTIIANSTSGGNCFGTITDRGYNLSDTNCGFSPANHDLINTNPQLGPLQNNGGPTQTMALLSTSPAIDQIPTSDASLCPTSGTDQRGKPRPDAGESVCDIGAYEYQDVVTTTTRLTSSANRSVFGQAVTFTATITPSVSGGAAPTGTVDFFDEGNKIGTRTVTTSKGVTTASFTTSSLSVGKHTITAIYNGDSDYNPSGATGGQAVIQTVSQASTSTGVTSSANPSASGQPVSFTAAVTVNAPGSGAPTGTIRFSIDGRLFGSPVSLSGGKATSQSTSSLAPGSHTISVTYSGDANYLGSSGSLTQTVNPSHLTGSLSSSLRPVEGQRSSGPVATFSDTNTFIAASQLSASISWGDGTSSSGTVSGSASHFTVSGSHSYADEGSYPVLVTLQEQTPGRASGTVSGTVIVAEGDRLTPSTTSASPATASRSYSGPVASFTDTDTANSPSDFAASINWGDGTTSTGTVSSSNGHLTVSGSHTYTLPGRYTVQTTIRDDAPGTASATATTSLLVMVPGSSSGITVEAYGTTDCTSVASSTKVSSSGSPSGTFAFRDERPGGSPCEAYRVGVLTLQAMGIDAVVCTSHTTASIYGRAKEGTNPSPSAAMVSFRADVAITSQNSPFNGTVSIQTSSGYTSGAVPASIHITGC